MPAQRLPTGRRRNQATLESDEDAKEDYGSDSSLPKRRRVDEELISNSGSQEMSSGNEDYPSNHLVNKSRTNGIGNPSDDEHQPGAIIRVQVANFVTYENAVFYPGPNLNMVIGPNGTGKSSLVCAICLGLGYSPKHLGRAGQVGEFVKHGSDHATIEIELKGKASESRNHVVRVRITRDGDKRKWWINDAETSLKSVQSLMKSFGIQVDNLCQFLPQDRVAEFAGLSPVELLHETQRAAAPEEMLVWHDQLKDLRKEQKGLQLQLGTDQETMANLQARQANLKGDVERLQERASIQEQIVLLEKSLPFIEYRGARDQHIAAKHNKKAADRRLKALEQEVAPTLRAVNEKQKYQGEIEAVVKDRRKVVQSCERSTDQALGSIEVLEEKIKEVDQTRKAEIDSDKSRKQEMQNTMGKIRDLKARLQNAPPEFDGAEWNAQIRTKDHRIRDIDLELKDIAGKELELKRRAGAVREQIASVDRQVEELSSQEGQQTNKLRAISQETFRAWQWCKENKSLFDHEVFGPPLVTCSVKDGRYTDAMESLLQKNDFLAFTVQSRGDYNKLNEQLYKTLRLADVSIRVITKTLDDPKFQRPASDEDRKAFGFDGWALDMLEGPDAVLAMLCNECKLHETGIGLQDVSEQQFQALENSRIMSWVTGRNNYRITRRREYGAGATSTTTKNIRNARNWTDQPVDAVEKRNLQEKRDGLQEEFVAMRTENSDCKAQVEQLRRDKILVKAEADELRAKKNEAQRIAGQFAALPQKIAREEENLEQKRSQGSQTRERLGKLSVRKDELVLEKLLQALKHKNLIGSLKLAHEELLEAEIRLLEASSDVEALMQHNSGIAQQLKEERENVQQIAAEMQHKKAVASRALEVCKAILEESEEDGEYYKTLDRDTTVESLGNDIAAERSKLELIHPGNAGAIKEFETRQNSIDKLAAKIEDFERKLRVMSANITEVREKWEPELDKLIGEISEAFSHNFEQIGCAGEVGVHKDEDFDMWSIEIKVKFRENETLQLLDQHRQSGGERSVSTIFYLMSLQSLARAPFRVVDEINQGMDPRNERMVHGRMVEIACKEHTSQYFLITPKLLTGLKYDERMRVLIIYSGEHMPADPRKLNIKKVIETRRRLAAAA